MSDKRFREMTADELARYEGPVHTALCVVWSDLSGRELRVDVEEPTAELLDASVARIVSLHGPLLERDGYLAPRRQFAANWAAAFGHGDDREWPSGTITAAEFRALAKEQ